MSLIKDFQKVQGVFEGVADFVESMVDSANPETGTKHEPAALATKLGEAITEFTKTESEVEGVAKHAKGLFGAMSGIKTTLEKIFNMIDNEIYF